MKEWLKANISTNINDQLWLIVVSLLAGVIIGLVYDGFRGWRRVCCLRCKCKCRGAKGQLPEKNLHVHIEDVLFVSFYIVVTYMIFYKYHYGAPAGYVFLGEGLGLLIYYGLLHNWGRCLFTCVFWQICTIFTCIYLIISSPFRVICGKLRKILKSIVKSVKIMIINN